MDLIKEKSDGVVYFFKNSYAPSSPTTIVAKVMTGMINQKVVYTPLSEAISKTTDLDEEMLTIARILAT